VVPRPLLESLARCDAPNLVGAVLGKPEIATGSGCDPIRAAAGCWERELSDRAAGADAPDLVALALDRPEIAVGSGCDIRGLALGYWDRELGDAPCRRSLNTCSWSSLNACSWRKLFNSSMICDP
jgi:hypothetical protein